MNQPFDNRDYDVQRLAVKDAEIERLNKRVVTLQNHCLGAAALAWWKVDARKLITEMADALDRSDPVQISIQEVALLIQRAKGAVQMREIQDEAYSEAMDEIAQYQEIVAGLRQRAKEKDAEIERLKADIDKLHKLSGGLLQDNHALLVSQLKDRKLIGELADALYDHMGFNTKRKFTQDEELVLRAREAIK